jgi:hypothetical protein
MTMRKEMEKDLRALIPNPQARNLTPWRESVYVLIPAFLDRWVPRAISGMIEVTEAGANPTFLVGHCEFCAHSVRHPNDQWIPRYYPTWARCEFPAMGDAENGCGSLIAIPEAMMEKDIPRAGLAVSPGFGCIHWKPKER